ncbi:MAG: hypothetical protein RI953_1128, partial [Pseudomonadota bacterium]
ILQALHETGHHQEVVRRSSTMLQNTTKDWLLGKIFKFNLDSRAMLVGLPVNSCEANESELSSRTKEIDEYLGVLDRFIRIAQKPERSVLLVRSAHALTLRGQFEKAIDRFEEGFSDSIDSEFTKSCAAFLVRKIESTGNSVMLEKFNRILMSKSIVPDGMSPENLRQSTAEAIFKNGNTLLARGNYDLAAEKFFSITKGFKSSPLFRPSLERLGFAYSKAKILDKAIAAYGKCLELETDPNKRRELTWTIAELNASAKEYDSAGRLFRKFRTDHPAEGLKRKAASFAARNFRFAGKFEDALSEYSLHVQQVQGPKEKLDAYWEIQETGVEAKNLRVQTEALTQIAKLEKDKSKLTKTYYLLMTTFNLSGQPSLARLNAEKIISTNDQSDESLVFIAEAKYYLGLLDLAEWRSRRQTMPSEPRAFIKSLAEKFENLRNLLLSPCDNPPAKGCSQGLLEAAKTGKQFHDLVVQLEIPKYYPKETVEELETYRSLVTDKLKIETVTALQKIVDREKKSKELTQLQAQEVQNLLSETKEVLDSPLEY